MRDSDIPFIKIADRVGVTTDFKAICVQWPPVINHSYLILDEEYIDGQATFRD